MLAGYCLVKRSAADIAFRVDVNSGSCQQHLYDFFHTILSRIVERRFAVSIGAIGISPRSQQKRYAFRCSEPNRLKERTVTRLPVAIDISSGGQQQLHTLFVLY